MQKSTVKALFVIAVISYMTATGLGIAVEPSSLLFFGPANLIVILLLIGNRYVQNPRNTYGTGLFLGERGSEILYEGLQKKFPFLEEVEIISTELGEIKILVILTTLNGMKLIIEGSLQYRPDPTITEPLPNGRGQTIEVNKFIGISLDVIRDGMNDMIESVVGAIGGQHHHEAFVKDRHAIVLIINSILRLRKLPHKTHKKSCNIKGCEWKDERNISPEDMLAFYRVHRKKVEEMLRGRSETSDVEELYGLNIEAFALSRVAFTEESEKALEEAEQAELRHRAFQTKLVAAKEVQDTLDGASAQGAMDFADTTMNPAIGKDVISVQGNSVFGELIGALRGKERKGGS